MIQEFRQFARDQTINLENEASMLCNFVRMHNRVRYWQFVPLKETQATKQACRDGFQAGVAARAKILKHEGDDAKNTWETPAEGALAREKMDEAQKKVNSIVNFLSSWERMDKELYPKKGKTRIPLTSGLKEVTKDAMHVYFWYLWLGEEGMKHHEQDKSW